MGFLYDLYLAVSRWILPILSLLLAGLWIMRYTKKSPAQTILARLETADGVYLPVFTTEGIIGRRKRSDVQLPISTISGKHAMFYCRAGRWYITPLRGEVWVNYRLVEGPTPLTDGVSVILSGEELFFCYGAPLHAEEYEEPAPKPATSIWMLLVLTLFQLVMMGQLCLRFAENLPTALPLCFFALILGEWIYYLAFRFMNSGCLLCEIPVLYLITLGIGVCVCSDADNLIKQLFCGIVGALGMVAFTLALKHQEFCYKFRYVFAGVTVAVMWFTVFFGTDAYGSRNWLTLGSVTVQPSEFAKIAFLLVGACSLAVTVNKKMNQWFYLLFAALVMGALVVMVDFGAVAVFFVALLVILLMRLAPLWLVGGIGGGALLAGGVVLALYPHVAQRFGAWLHVWEYASSDGYQQTRTMIAAASGGLLGVGGGNGTLLSVAAADTDLVFGVLCEEYGCLVGLCAALCFVALCLYARRLAKETDNGFHAIGVCGAATMMLFQAALNIFGSTDILPLTGVTMVFVSRGGTSLLAAFFMISFFKAAEFPAKPIVAESRRRA